MTPEELANGIVRQHMQECVRLQGALDSNDEEAIHAFRLACKSLRYAIERFGLGAMSGEAGGLAKITEELGFWHDCVLLAKRARKAGASAVAWRAAQDRKRYMQSGRSLWQKLAPSIERRVA